MNKTAAAEWLIKALHDIGSAEILYNAEYYTDVIGVDLHYAIEKTLKSFLAYENVRILKTHNLLELYTKISDKIEFSDEELDLLEIATGYHITEVYPLAQRVLPGRDEILRILKFAQNLFKDVCRKLEIDNNDLN